MDGNCSSSGDEGEGFNYANFLASCNKKSELETSEDTPNKNNTKEAIVGNTNGNEVDVDACVLEKPEHGKVVEKENKDATVIIIDDEKSDPSCKESSKNASSSDEESSSSEEESSSSEEESSSDESSSEDKEIQKNLLGMLREEEEDLSKKMKSISLVKTVLSGEIVIKNKPSDDELPPELKIVSIKLPQSTQLQQVGKVETIIEDKVITIQGNGSCTLDIESVLFLGNGESLGVISDVFGPVSQPMYAVLVDDLNKEIVKGAPVYIEPNNEGYTKFVLKKNLCQRGSDASWIKNVEPPAKELDYSDDEQEREAKKKKKGTKRSLKQDETECPQKNPSFQNHPISTNVRPPQNVSMQPQHRHSFHAPPTPNFPAQQYRNGPPHPHRNQSPHQFQNGPPHSYRNESPQSFRNGAPHPYQNGAPHPYQNESPHQFRNGAPHRMPMPLPNPMMRPSRYPSQPPPSQGNHNMFN